MAGNVTLTATEILAAATEYLESAGYRRAPEARDEEWPAANRRVFEDALSVVAVAVYDTWADLSKAWSEAQGALVDLISKHVSSVEAKAWEGYLVIFTPGVPGTEGRAEATEIRYDTSRVRKLLATGDELKDPTDVERTLLPLLPLTAGVELQEPQSVLDMLPELLSNRGIGEDAVGVVLDAFHRQEPLVERLHAFRTAQ